MQKFEFIVKDIKNPLLTVTPTRITVKVPLNRTEAQHKELIDRGLVVAKKLGQVTTSWRGIIGETRSVMSIGRGETRRRSRTKINYDTNE